MTTELSLVYSIIETLRESEYNNDEKLNERFVRSLIHQYRVDSLRKYSANGARFSDEVFQKKTLVLKQMNLLEYVVELPKIIRTNNDYGFYIEKNGIPIPINNSEAYRLYKKGFSGFYPKAKTEQNTLTLFIGEENQCTEENSELYLLMKFLKEGIEEAGALEIDLRAVLFNPEDADNYDWENDIFPFPAERIEEMRTQLMVKEYGIMINAKKDEVANARADNIRYHDNTDINQNKTTD